MKAAWNKQTIAESDNTIPLEGYHYFPEKDVDMSFLQASDHKSSCAWKGLATYWHVVVDGKVNENAAWTYADPKPEAEKIRGHIGFWKGVELSDW
jgi:uncharacterized protein (DUF427 family)